MKFKSLAMHIWVTFTVVILIIVTLLSSIYLTVFRAIDENAKMKDLSFAHSILLENDLTQPISLDTMQNLRGSTHIIYSADGVIREIGKLYQRTGPSPSHNDKNYRRDVENEICTYAKENQSYAEFKELLNGRKFLFIISQVENGFLISYMPSMYDNFAVYYLFLIAFVFILIGLVAAKLVSKSISKPISNLKSFTERVAAHDFDEPVKIEGDGEIASLAIAMNTMQKNLKRADEEEKIFLQSISHDLKTPVMVIMSHADAIIDGVYIGSVENTAEIIKNEAVSLSNKIKELLYFNTLDFVLQNQSEKGVVDMQALIFDTVNRLKPIKGDIFWDLNVFPAEIVADKAKINVAVENVIDNAIRYAKSKICISLKQSAGKVTLRISDDGKKIENENLDKIFDHMYKDKTGNFGLGLAITKKIVNFYGGTIRAENDDDGVSLIFEF